MTQRAPLTVRNAEINTAAVKINTLQISGKQVTLAVFRQLPEEYPIEDGTWKGLPWGWVNYLCERGERNVVWQRDEDLKRGIMRLPPEHPPIDLRSGWKWYWASVRDGRIEHKPNNHIFLRFALPDGRSFALKSGLRPSIDRDSFTGRTVEWPEETTDSLLAQLTLERDSVDRSHSMAWERWRELAVLPQLFIAV